MQPKDKLVRKACPLCGAMITLDSRTLHKKIRCPKCRQPVVIADDAAATDDPPARSTEAPPPPERQVAAVAPPAPVPPAPVKASPEPPDHASEEMPPSSGERRVSEVDRRNPVFYCLCDGVLKKRNAAGGGGASPCCMWRDSSAALGRVEVKPASSPGVAQKTQEQDLGTGFHIVQVVAKDSVPSDGEGRPKEKVVESATKVFKRAASEAYGRILKVG